MSVRSGGPLQRARRSLARGLDEAVRRGKELQASWQERAGDLSLRYIVCAEPDAWERVLAGHLEKIPTTRGLPLLVENEVLAFQRTLRPTGRWGRVISHWEHEPIFHSLDAYRALWPAAVELSPYESVYPTYQLRRVPGVDEVSQIANNNAMVRRMLDVEMPHQEILLAIVALHQYCNADSDDLPEYRESYVLRPLAGAFLLITNHGARPVDLQAIEVSSVAQATRRFRPLGAAYEGSVEPVPLSAPPLHPQESMLIPIGTLVRPFGRLSYVEYSRARKEFSKDTMVTRFWDMRRVLGEDPGLEHRHHLIGPAVFPKALDRREGWGRGTVPVRPFDVGRLSLLDVDNHWGLEAGSCPHLFFVHGRTAALRYAGEAFTGAPGQRCQDELTVPPDAALLVLAELEEEVTELVGVWVDEVRAHGHAMLRRGDWISVRVRPGQRVRLVGRYFVGTGGTPQSLPEHEKLTRVLRFMEGFTA